MATRATYLISTGNFQQEMLCFYIHWDNFPEDAAHYFWRMNQIKNPRSGYAGRFFRANEAAEFTLSHETRGGTEYRYTLDQEGKLTAWQYSFEACCWKVFFEGLWYDFVNQYLGEEKTLYPFTEYGLVDKPLVMTLTEAQTYIDEKRQFAQQASAEDRPSVAAHAEKEAETIQSQIYALNRSLKT